MSFANLLPLAFQAVSLLNQTMRMFQAINEEKEKAKREIKEKIGQEIDVEIGVIKVEGKAKIAVLIDLPGEVELPLAQLAKAVGLNIEILEGKKIG